MRPGVKITDNEDQYKDSVTGKVGRPRRKIKPPDRFISDSTDLLRCSTTLPYGEDDDDEVASLGSDHHEEKIDISLVVLPPKKRRGRPPKQRVVEQVEKPTQNNVCSVDDTFNKSDTVGNVAVPPKKRRGRPPKAKPVEEVHQTCASKPRTRPAAPKATSESELDDGSDYEPSPTMVNKWNRFGGKNVGTVRKKLANKKPQYKSPNGKDAKIHAYLEEFVCEYCPEKVLFERFSEATHHYKDVHMERAFLKCPKCDKKTYTPGEFISHVETHNDPDRCKCTVCGKMTPSKVALNKHMRCHQVDLEGNHPFPCRMCPRRFEEESKRDRHELLHKPKPVISRQYGRDESMLEFYKRIYCDVCEEAQPGSTSFDNFWDLKVHMNKKHDKAPYLKCPECPKKMGVRHQIMMHIDVHKNPELYRCEICNEIHQYLDRHMIAAHTPTTAMPEKKRYNCDQCGKVFRYRWKLKYHINEAHGLKDVSCDICKKFFTRPALAAHKRKVHVEGVQESFLCDLCPKMFLKQHSLRMHIAFAHENLRKHKKCNLCGKEVSGLSKHMQMVHPSDGPATCDLCGKRFRSSFHMKRHRVNTCAATINSRPYKCEVCGKGFSLKLTMTEHMTTHTRTNLYQCAFCLKTYGYLSNLQKHRKKAHPLEWKEVQRDQSIVTVISLATSAPVPASDNALETQYVSYPETT